VTKPNRKFKFLRFQSRKILFLLMGLIIIFFIVGDLISPGFASFSHIGAILRTSSFLGIVSIGQTLTVLSAGIDLSVGPLVTMGNVFSCMLINGANANTVWAIAVVILIGAVFGALNGLGVAYLKISPLVMTLAVGSLVTGITLIISHGAPKGLASPILRFIGVGSVFGGIPIIVVVWMILGALIILLQRSTVFGRKIYYIGANPRTSYYSGIRVNTVLTLVYALSGGAATLTGVLMAGYTHTAYLGIGNEYILWSITAVVIGGTALTGGKGGYGGTIAGAILLVLIESLLTVVKMPEAGRKIATGVLILIMISIYYRQKNRQ
jgi:ribose transport system permease protein